MQSDRTDNVNGLRHTFNRNDFWMAAAAIVLGAYFLAKEWTRSRAPEEGWPWPEIGVALTGLLFGIVLLAGYPWARWLGLPWLAALTVMVIVDGIALHWDFGALSSAGLLSALIIFYCGLFFAGKEDVN